MLVSSCSNIPGHKYCRKTRAGENVVIFQMSYPQWPWPMSKNVKNQGLDGQCVPPSPFAIIENIYDNLNTNISAHQMSLRHIIYHTKTWSLAHLRAVYTSDFARCDCHPDVCNRLMIIYALRYPLMTVDERSSSSILRNRAWRSFIYRNMSKLSRF